MSSDDIDAINSYIVNAAIQSPEAGNLQAQWKTYYGNLGFFDKGSDATLAEASNRRTIFNAANHQPEDIQGAADLTPARAVAKQAAIASSTALSPAQKTAALAKNPNIKVPATGATAHGTIRQGSSGSDVIAWQQILGIAQTGVFDAATTAATKKWQLMKGLTADGVVGPLTWGKALATVVQPLGVPVAVPVAVRPMTPAAAPTPVVAPAAAALATNSGSQALQIGLPAVGFAAGCAIGGPIGGIIGGLVGLFGASKV
jgi:murein L,D-transpeptidase YcbB/YkuD